MARRVIAPAAGVKNIDALRIFVLAESTIPERSDGATDHTRVSFGHTGGVFADHRIGSADQLVQAFDTVGVGDVKDHRALTGVEVAEQSTAVAAIGEDGSHCPGAAAAPGRLDFDHLGAEVGQQFAAVFACYRVGQLNNPDSRQCRHTRTRRAVRASCAPIDSGATPAGS